MKRLTRSLPVLVLFLLSFVINAPAVRAGRISGRVVVPYSGAPSYVAETTVGSPMSDYGSHFGVKAMLGERRAGSLAHYLSTTSMNTGMLDRSTVVVSEGNREYFAPAFERHVRFLPYAIDDVSMDNGMRLETECFFAQTDVLVLAVALTNEGITPRSLKASLCFEADWDILGRGSEGSFPHLELGGVTAHKRGTGVILTNYFRFPGPSVGRTVGCSSPIRHVKGNVFQDSYRLVLEGDPVRLAPGESMRRTYTIALVDDDKAEPLAPDHTAHELRQKTILNWQSFFDALPRPHSTDPQALEMYRLAATALRMNLYAPRNAGQSWNSVPAKVHFNYFWGWDTPLQVLGQAEWSPTLGWDGLQTQLARAGKGWIPNRIDDAGTASASWVSQPPVQAWAAWQTWLRESAAEARGRYAASAVGPLTNNVIWWQEHRKGPYGLACYKNGLESGWDDSPRFYDISLIRNMVAILPRKTAAIDLNCWLYQTLDLSSRMADSLGDGHKAAEARENANDLARKVEDHMWSSTKGAWADLDRWGRERPVGSAAWWPLFVGLTRSEERARLLVEKHLLNPASFNGEYGIPTTPFNDSRFNHREDGYYWRGQVWLVPNYAALVALYRYGYEREAETLAQKLIRLTEGKGGLYETYNSRTGEVGRGSAGYGEAAAFQFGMTSALMMEILLHRYQEERFIMPGEKELSGYVRYLTPLSGGTWPAFIEVAEPGENVPYAVIRSADGLSLDASHQLEMTFTDPYGNCKSNSVRVLWAGEEYRVKLNETTILGRP